MKHMIFFLIALSWLVTPGFASDDMAKMKKELRIFNRIVKESFGGQDGFGWEDTGEERLVPQHLESTYLHGQGVVLTVDLKFPRAGLTGDHFFPQPNFHFRDKVLFSHPEEMEKNAELKAMVEKAANVAEEVNAQLMDKIAALQEERYGSEEHQEAMRKLKEEHAIAVEAARAEATETRKRLLQENEELNEERQREIAAQLKALKEDMFKKKEQNIDRIKQIREEQRENWSNRLETFETQLVDVLCEYGGTVYQLPDDEFFTVVLADADISGDNPKDKIYVFKKADLLACRDGEMARSELKSRSHTYSF